MKKRFSKYDKSFLVSSKVARLATYSPEGYPHVVPLWFLYLNNRIYMATDRNSKKVRNIGKNSSVTVLVDAYVEEEKFGESSWDIKGLMIHGTAKIIERGKKYNKILDELLQLKYAVYYEKEERWEAGEAVVIEIEPKEFCRWETEDIFEKELEKLEEMEREVEKIKKRLEKVEKDKIIRD